MPQFFIEAPTGIRPDAKARMMREVSAAIEEAYPIPDVRVWLREYPDNPQIVEAIGRLNT